MLERILQSKTLRRIALPTVLIAGAYGIVSCGKDKITNNPEPEQETELAQNTRVLEDPTLQEIQSYNGQTFIFSNPTDLSEGDIIAGGISTTTPNGFLRKIDSISPDKRTIQTSQATLEEAIERCEFEATGTLSGTKGFGFNIPLSATLYDADGDPSTGGDQILAYGNLSFDYDYEFRLKIDDFEIQELRFNNILNESAEVDFYAHVSGRVDDNEWTIAEFPLPSFVITIPTTPPLPIVFTPEIEANLGAEGYVASGLNSIIRQTAQLQAGIEYKEGRWGIINSLENSFIFDYTYPTEDMSIKAYAGPEIVFYMYGIAGPSAEVNATLQLDGDLEGNPCLAIYGGLEAKVGFEMEILGETIADHEETVFDIRNLLHETECEPQEPQEPIGEFLVGCNYDRAIFHLNRDGSEQKRLADGRSPAWSPDGERIAYVLPFQEEIWIINKYGDNPTYLTDGFAPTWSPDGQDIAFCYRENDNINIFKTKADGSGSPERLITHELDDFDPAWSPTGTLAFERHSYQGYASSILLADQDGSNERVITRGWDPTFSSDGRYVAFSGYHQQADHRDILTYDTETGTTTDLTNHPAFHEKNPIYSSDGREIAYIIKGAADAIRIIDSETGETINSFYPDCSRETIGSFDWYSN